MRGPLLRGLLCLVLLVLVLPGGALVAEVEVKRYPIETRHGRPFEMTVGPDENLWFVFLGAGLARVTPSGQITEFDGCGTSITVGPDDHLWCASNGQVWRAATAGEVTPFECLGCRELFGIARGSDGNLWFTGEDLLGRATPTGEITTFPLEGLGAGIVSGPNGNLWFGLGRDGEQPSSLIEWNPVTGLENDLRLKTFDTPYTLAVGPNGTIWYGTIQKPDWMGVVRGGELIEVRVDDPVQGFTLATDGRFFAAIGNTAGSDASIRLVREDLSFELVTDDAAGPRGLTIGPDGALWFLEVIADNVVRVELPPTATPPAADPPASSIPSATTRTTPDAAPTALPTPSSSAGLPSSSPADDGLVLRLFGGTPRAIDSGSPEPADDAEDDGLRRILLAVAIGVFLVALLGAIGLSLHARRMVRRASGPTPR